jgi:hypothetical protein
MKHNVIIAAQADVPRWYRIVIASLRDHAESQNGHTASLSLADSQVRYV